MRILIRFVTAVVLSIFILNGKPAFAAKTPVMTTQVYALASRGDIATLKKIRHLIDKTDYAGRTALCWAVKKKNYKAYHTLTRAGANRKHQCVRQFSSEEIRAFNQGYREWAYTGGQVAGAETTETKTGLSTAAKVGIGVGTVAVIGGGIALVAGGGGGSKSKGDDGGGSVPATCDGYDLSACPAGGVCDVCSTGARMFYRMTSCRDGYKQEGDICVPEEESDCPANTYGHGHSCASCPANSTSVAGSISIDDCICKAGYTKMSNVCVADSSGGSSQKTSPSTFTADTHYRTTGTLAAIRAADAYAKFIRVNPDGSYDYSSLADVKVIVDDSVGEQNYGSYPVVEHSAIRYATTTNGDRDYLYPSAGVGNIFYTTQGADYSFYHGVAVSSVIAAKWNSSNNYWGVAPNASVYMVSFIADTEKLYQAAFQKGARVANQSYTLVYDADTTRTSRYASGSTLESALNSLSYYVYSHDDSLLQAAKNNAVIVKSAGNYYDMSGPTCDNAMGAAQKKWTEGGKTYSLENLFITAVAATSKISGNTLKDYSHYCGWAQSWCLAAPVGTHVAAISTTAANIDSKYYVKSYNEISGTFSGTSNAAPVISGGVAFLMGAYPYLTSQQIVEILFRSANKTVFSGWDNDGTWTDSFGNTYRTSSKYGHGMLDLNAATEPLGVLSVATGLGEETTMGDLTAISKTPVDETQLVFPGFLYTEDQLPEMIMGLDDYNRPFSVETASMINRSTHTDRAWRRSFKSFMSRDKRTKVNPSDKLSFEFASSVTADDLAGMGVFDMTYRTGKQSSLLFSYRSDVLGEEKYFERTLANPFLDMTDSYGLTQKFGLTQKLSFSVGASLGKNGFYEAEEEDDDINRSIYAFVSDVGYQINSQWALRLTGGMVTEKEAVLGMNGTGAFQTQNGRTYFTGAVVDYHPIPAVKLSASYYLGRTESHRSEQLISFDDLLSDSFAFNADYAVTDKNKVGFLLYAPLRIKSGSADFRLPVRRDTETDRIYYEDVRLGLKPNAREYDVGLYYTSEQKSYDWRTEFMTRFHPDHRSGISPDYRVLFGLVWKY